LFHQLHGNELKKKLPLSSIQFIFKGCLVIREMAQVKQVLGTEGSIAGHLRECQFLSLPLNLDEANEDQVPGDLILRDPATSGSMINGTRRVGCVKKKRKNNEEAPPCPLVRLHRRKGVPRRSPLY